MIKNQIKKINKMIRKQKNLVINIIIIIALILLIYIINNQKLELKENFEGCSNVCGLFEGKIIPCPPPPCGKRVEVKDFISRDSISRDLKNKEILASMEPGEKKVIDGITITLESENVVRVLDDSCICKNNK